MSGQIQVFGLAGLVCVVNAKITWCVSDVKAAIQASTGIPRRAQRLLAGEVELRDKDDVFQHISAGTGILNLIRRPELQVKWIERIELDGPILAQAPAEVLEDREVILLAVNRCGLAIQHAASELRADKELSLVAVRRSGLALQYLAADLRADRELVLAAVKSNALALEHAAADLQGDREIILLALRQNKYLVHGHVLEHVAEHLRSDREIVLAALRQNGTSLKFAAPELQEDREIVVEAIRQDWNSLMYAGCLRADAKIVEEAVRQDWRALMHATLINREVLALALEQDGCALKYAPSEFRADRQLVFKAVRQNRKALRYVVGTLGSDPELAIAASGTSLVPQRNARGKRIEA